MLTPADLLLSDAELVALTGYKRASEQIAELHRQGFVRARKSMAGGVILERAHYEAVCRGPQVQAPKVRKPTVRMA